jgi:hypothetical protein
MTHDELLIGITQQVGSECAHVFSQAFAAATDDPQTHALIATISWICANDRLSVGDRLGNVVKIVDLTRLA